MYLCTMLELVLCPNVKTGWGDGQVQGIRLSTENNDVIIFARKINNDSTTSSLGQPGFSSHYFFRPGQLGNAESLFFSPGTCQGPSHYFSSVVKSLFLATQHLCTKHCCGENIPPDSPEGQPINAESLFFRPGCPGNVKSLFFSAGPAR